MSGFIKKAGKGTSGLASAALKKAFAGILGDLAKEILEDTGVADMAKDKIMEVGLKVVKEMKIDPRSFQRDIVKHAIMKEMKLK
ncbi:MAG: hypothetical protein IH840_09280 [Candidatus Heimdallarchaeota archaeon]|nr:hypothetical protein [Candidatus Heimdallarchaeota archaeon]